MAFLRKRRFLPGLLACVLAVLALAAIADYLYYRDRIYPGVLLRDREVGGLSRKEIKEELLGLQMTFSGPGGFHARLRLQDMGILVDPEETSAAAYLPGRQKPWPLSYGERLTLYRRGSFLPLYYRVDGESFSQSVRMLADSFARDPRDAYFQVREDGGWAELKEGEEGFLADQEALRENIRRTLARLNTPLDVEIPVQEVLAPAITASLLQERGVVGLMSSFATEFHRDNENRAHNIKLGASHLHNSFLPPGEVLSLNALLEQEKGYKEAPVIVDGELVPGLGGGLCQVSTTLYNAALLANLPILERRNHALTVPYVDPGRDATIAFSAIDLKIQNDRDHYIWITAQIPGDRLAISIFGRPLMETIELETRILETYEPPVQHKYDPDLAFGEEKVEEGQPGHLVEVWKRVYREGQAVSEKIISLDRYRPRPTVIWQGTLEEKGP